MAKANDTEFGLAAGVFTTDLKRAHAFANGLHAGNVYVNTFNDVGKLCFEIVLSYCNCEIIFFFQLLGYLLVAITSPGTAARTEKRPLNTTLK